MSSAETFVAEAEGPEILGANIMVGARLLASATAFLFMAFVFAFLYLRELNTNHAFRMPHSDPPTGFGAAILVCVLGSTAVFSLARRQLGSGAEGAWRIGSPVALILALAVVVLQVAEYLSLSFGAQSGGLASVFYGFSALFGIFWLGAVYWIETLWAQSVRRPEREESGIAAPTQLLRPSADGCVVFLYTMAVSEIIAFVLLYLVK
jgi:heme/copper-type cytochrome/quinol oxidase subunit 3